MKLAVILMLAAVIQVSAKGTAQTVTYSANHEPLKKVLAEIKRQTGYAVFYRNQDISHIPLISVELDKATLSDALDEIFKHLPLEYNLEENTVFIKKKPTVSPAFPSLFAAPPVLVRGRILNEKGEPVSASIIIKGTNRGTMTDADGAFELVDVNENALLLISGITIESKEVRVSVNAMTIIVTTKIGAEEEIVINGGYYKIEDRKKTGSISRVSSKDIENQPVSNALSAVQGRMAGVSIVQNSGVPGSGYDIQIRGRNSLRWAGNAPLYIIDGVPVTSENPTTYSGTILPYGAIDPLNAISPNDIKSIEVLKDADATAIYGSRGGNGVILITTRKAGSGQPAFTVNTSYAMSKVASRMKLMNTEQYLGMRKQAFANDGMTAYPDYAYDVNGSWDVSRYTDWQKALIGNTSKQSSVQVSVNGGSETTKFLISGTYNQQGTVFPADFAYKTYNFMGNLSHTSMDKRFDLNWSTVFSAQDNNVINSDITNQTLRLIPSAPVLYKEDGSLNWQDNTFENPLSSFEGTYANHNKTLNTNLNVRYALLPSVNIILNGGINQQVFEELVLNPSTMYNPAWGITPASSMAFKSTRQRFSYILEPQLNYHRQFRQHGIEVLFGGTYQQNKTAGLAAEGYGFETNALISNLAAAQTIVTSADIDQVYKYMAVFGRLSYQFKERYMLNLTARRDGSSRFGPSRRFSNFGAVGAAWIFSKEHFMQQIDWLSYAKLRSSYGVTGSDAIGDYQYFDTYSITSSRYGGVAGLIPSRLFNPSFSWEQTNKLELALEWGLFKDRITMSAAWYRNRSGSQLVGIPLPATTGFSNVLSNLPATVENRGVEVEMHARLVNATNWSWESSFNISFPQNKLVSFPDLEGSTYSERYVVGYPTSILKVYNYEGIDPSTGRYTFTDYNRDGIINSPQDNQVIEKIGIRYFGGWSNQLHYRKFNFSFLFQFVNQRQPNYHNLMPTPGSMYNQPTEVLDVWSVDHPNGRYMPYTTKGNPLHGLLAGSTAGVSSASFVRLKNVQFSYGLSLKKWKLKDLNIYVQGQNLWTITNYFGLDPEFLLTGYLPPLKTFSMGFQLKL